MSSFDDKNEEKKNKLVNNKLNTKIIFKTESKRNNNQKLNKTKTMKNPKQIFKKINLKTASRLINNSKAFNILKIKSINKTDSKNNTIKAIKTSIKYKEKTYIPNERNIKNKYIIAISEPPTYINDTNKKIENKIKKGNPFNSIIQPIDPMTQEMEKFKKMRMREKKYINKQLSSQTMVNSSNQVHKNNTNIKINNIIKNEMFFEQKEKNEKTEEEISKEELNVYKSYVDNIKKVKNTQKNDFTTINNKQTINSSISYSNSKSINNNSLKIDLNFRKNDLNNTNTIPNDHYNPKLLKERAKKITQEKEALKNELKSKKSSSSNALPKRNITRVKNANRNSKNFEKKKLIIDINYIKSYEDIQGKSQTTKGSKKISSNNTKRVNIKKINNNNNIQTTNKLNIVNKMIKTICEIIYLNIKSKIEFCFDKIKSYDLNKNNNMNKKSISNLKNDKIKKIMKMKLLLNIEPKRKEINKEGFDIYYNFIDKKISSFKKFFLLKLKNYINNKEKLESTKIVKKIINNKYISNIKFFFISIKKYISSKNKIRATKKIILFFSNSYKSLISKAFFNIKIFVKIIKQLEATKRLYFCLSKNIINKKYNILYCFKQYLKAIKQKKFGIIMLKIFSMKIRNVKKFIFNKIILHNKKSKKIININKIKNLAKKVKKKYIKTFLYLFKSVGEYKNKLKASGYINELLTKKILLNRNIYFNRIKKFFIMKKRIEGFYRFNDYIQQKRIDKLKIYFNDFINNINKLKINKAHAIIDKIYLSKKVKIKKDVLLKLQKIYKKQINIKKLLKVLETIINKEIKEKKINFIESFNNYIKEKTKIKRWFNNRIDNNTNNIVISSKNKIVKSNNILNEERISFSLSKNKDKNVKLNNNEESLEESDDEIWTTCIEKWGVIHNSDDSLYQSKEE